MALWHWSLIDDPLQLPRDQALISCHLCPTITLFINLNTCPLTHCPMMWRLLLTTFRSASLILTEPNPIISKWLKPCLIPRNWLSTIPDIPSQYYVTLVFCPPTNTECTVTVHHLLKRFSKIFWKSELFGKKRMFNYEILWSIYIRLPILYMNIEYQTH